MAVSDGTPFILTTVEQMARWGQKNSIWPLTMGLACCAIEMMSLVTPRFDSARFGAEVFRASPRQADLMIVSGRVCHKMVPVIKQLYEQMPEPKWVMSMGSCACSGGVFNNYAVVQGVDQILPVDIYVPGCPPTPEQVLEAILQLRDQIGKGDPKAGLPIIKVAQ
ncbi:MAG TPA: NADH-quinone oxidoreductase subunit B family protein [Bacillota bacterium]|nr:NADH-quinone oxidoreductase subunit B family protein [Bacillota bacterium]